MVKLNRIDQPLFAGNNVDTDQEVAVFGTMKTSAVYTMNVATLLSASAYQEGWQEAVVVGYAPFLEELNGVQYAFSYQLAYNQQQGIPEWSGTMTYYIGSLVKLNTPTGCKVYASKIDDNIGNLLTDTASWKLVVDSDLTYASTTDVASAISTMLSTLYPVGACYMGTQTTCPLSSLMPGTTWSLVSSGRALWTGTGSNGNSTIAAGLPNITGNFQAMQRSGYTATAGAFYNANGGVIHSGSSHTPTNDTYGRFYFNASRSSSIYGNSSTVQPPAYVVNVWRRTA